MFGVTISSIKDNEDRRIWLLEDPVDAKIYSEVTAKANLVVNLKYDLSS